MKGCGICLKISALHVLGTDHPLGAAAFKSSVAGGSAFSPGLAGGIAPPSPLLSGIGGRANSSQSAGVFRGRSSSGAGGEQVGASNSLRRPSPLVLPGLTGGGGSSSLGGLPGRNSSGTAGTTTGAPPRLPLAGFSSTGAGGATVRHTLNLSQNLHPTRKTPVQFPMRLEGQKGSTEGCVARVEGQKGRFAITFFGLPGSERTESNNSQQSGGTAHWRGDRAVIKNHREADRICAAGAVESAPAWPRAPGEPVSSSDGGSQAGSSAGKDITLKVKRDKIIDGSGAVL